jgi:hypothetical protein
MSEVQAGPAKPVITVFQLDAFGNALGNAAIGEIQRQNAISEQKQRTPTSSLLAADNPNSHVNPVAAFLTGPYANMDIGNGVSDAQIAAYEASGLPTLASVGAAATYAAVNGGGQERVDVTMPAFLEDSRTGALSQLDYDAQWMNYANAMAQQPGGVVDAASIQAAQEAYNAAANSDTSINVGQYDPAKVQALDDALNDMIDSNGWSFGPPESAGNAQPVTLSTITVTPTAADIAQTRSYGDVWGLGGVAGTTDLGQSYSFLWGLDQNSEFPLPDAQTTQDIAGDFGTGMSFLEIGNRGVAQYGALAILNRAAPLQMDRMSAISRSTTFEQLEGVLENTSKSGRWIGDVAKASSKWVTPVALTADGIYLAADIKQAAPGQVPLVAAKDVTSFAAEWTVGAAGAETGAAVGLWFSPEFGPFAPFVEAGFGLGGAAIALGVYNAKHGPEAVKAYVGNVWKDVGSEWNKFQDGLDYTAKYIQCLTTPGATPWCRP